MLVGVAVAGFLAVLIFGLITGRIDWRQKGCCCPADPADDARMNSHDTTSISSSSTTGSRES